MSFILYSAVAMSILLISGSLYFYTKSWTWAGSSLVTLAFIFGVYIYTQSILLTLIPTAVLVVIAGLIIYFRSRGGDSGSLAPGNVSWKLD